jgi:hypothetical protein
MDNFSYSYMKSNSNVPPYTDKSPEEIVTDYLTRVFTAVGEHFRSIIPANVLNRLLVDLVVTIPAARNQLNSSS